MVLVPGLCLQWTAIPGLHPGQRETSLSVIQGKALHRRVADWQGLAVGPTPHT